MDFIALSRLVLLDKNEITFGVLAALLLLSLIALLVRSVREEKASSAAGGGRASSIDATAINDVIEGALKKALSENPAAVGVAASASQEVSGDAKELKKTLHEREAKIAALMSDLEAVKGQVDKSAAGGASGEDTSALQSKIKELQSKLAEYEIIEDDIADLSIYKEENKKLKDEVDKLRAAVETAKTQVQAAQVATDPVPLVDPVQAAQAAVVSAAEPAASAPASAAAVEAPRPPAEPFKLDPADSVMAEFAEALGGSPDASIESNLISGAELSDPQAAIDALFSTPPPAAAQPAPAEPKTETTQRKTEPAEAPSDPFGELDTEKMLAEVASMKDAAASSDGTSVLDEQLDTDRLMAEMGIGDSAAQEVASAPSAPVAVAEPTIASKAIAALKADVTPEIVESEIPVDDLLAEFKDMDLLKGTKGS